MSMRSAPNYTHPSHELTYINVYMFLPSVYRTRPDHWQTDRLTDNWFSSSAQAKAKPKSKAKSKAKGKAKAKSSKRSHEEVGEPGGIGGQESFTSQFVDCLGNTRVTLFGDDLCNAINFTLERVGGQNHKPEVVAMAFDIGCIFALTGKVEVPSIGFSKCTAWTKCRVQIKRYVNRMHSLKARTSDPDLPTKDDVDGDEDEKEDEVEDEDDSLTALLAILRGINDKQFLSFLDDNFSRLAKDSSTEIPTVASVIENQPAMIKVINKMKRFINNFLSRHFQSSSSPDLQDESDGRSDGLECQTFPAKETLVKDIMMELTNIVNSIFDPAYMELLLALIGMQDDTNTGPMASSYLVFT